MAEIQPCRRDHSSAHGHAVCQLDQMYLELPLILDCLQSRRQVLAVALLERLLDRREVRHG
jgi:hypothetical protein